MKKSRFCRLKTPFEEAPDWSVYPRPQMRRDSFLSLCGEWKLSVKKGKTVSELGRIIVPFPPESEISGIGRTLEKGERYLYEKMFTVAQNFCRGRILLHFGAVDQIAQIFLDGKSIFRHVGGYLPFTIDITEYASVGTHALAVEVSDELDMAIPYGKQRKKRGGMWYTPISGIWQPVWLESVPKSYIRSMKLTATTSEITVETTGGAGEKLLAIETSGGISEYRYHGDRITVVIEDPVLWTPENPHLYPFTLTCGEDKIKSYFALRTISCGKVNGKSCILLNEKPYFFHGLLDQGYFSDGIYLPASPEGYHFDVLKMKELGFNMLRKHIKIEPDIFYYDCDRYGMIVFQDMVNNGHYSFLRDTALPTIGIKKGVVKRASKRSKEYFEMTAKETVALLYNHPSVCYYTIFNEGWGQYEADRIYEQLKALDPTRVFDATSGWFAETKSDVQSEHIYFKKLDLKAGALPLVLSEFGGYSCKIEGHAFNLDKTYGYRLFEKREDFEKALEVLYRDEVIPMIKRGLCAAVLTQVSDVEDETNGLVTYDRKVVKVEAAKMQRLAADLRAAFASVWETHGFSREN